MVDDHMIKTLPFGTSSFYTSPCTTFNNEIIPPSLSFEIKCILRSTEVVTLQSVKNTWHPCKVDIEALGKPEYAEDEIQSKYQLHSAV